MKHKGKTCIRRTAASKASKEERASLARSDGQEGDGMRGNQGRREPSQGGAGCGQNIILSAVQH